MSKRSPRKELDFAGLGEFLLGRVRELLPEWLPGGKMSGKEYVCSNLLGGNGGSFSINTRTGAWADFNDPELKGGDLISLYAAIQGIKNAPAAKRLSEQYNYQLGVERAPKAPAPKEDPLIVIPDGIEPPKGMRHPFHNIDASKSWRYRNANGDTLFWIARYDLADGKEFLPWAHNGKHFVNRAWEVPRPLYGLDRLAASPEAPVLVVEGEKTADAAQEIVGNNYIVTTWPGGAASPQTADLKPLAGRKILLWPDADAKKANEVQAKKYGINIGDLIAYEHQPGPHAMDLLAAELFNICPQVKVLDVREQPDGWDAADAKAAGWTWEDLVTWAKPRATVFQVRQNAQTIVNAAPGSQVTVNVGDDSAAPEDGDSDLIGEWERLGIATTQAGHAICNFDNALRVLENEPEFAGIVWYDDFHNRYFTDFSVSEWQKVPVREWRDSDELHLLTYMQRHLGLRKMSDDMIHKAAMTYADRHHRNEPRDWMETLTWDKEPRIETFLTRSFGAKDSEYTRAASMNFWIGMAARVYRPGCQLDNMLILKGKQGIGKTKALRMIGGNWYSEANESVMSKDFFMVLHGKLLVEIAEMNAFGKAENTRIKQVVTCTTDRYRAPYERAAQDHPRMSLFVGTTNDDEPLRDSSGGRRFWPVSCTQIRQDIIAQERHQLFAEAVARLKAGATWHEMPAGTAEEQEANRRADEWEGLIASWLVGKNETTLAEVSTECLKVERARLDVATQMRVGHALRRMGWEPRNLFRDNAQRKVWVDGRTPALIEEPGEEAPAKEELTLSE